MGDDWAEFARAREDMGRCGTHAADAWWRGDVGMDE